MTKQGKLTALAAASFANGLIVAGLVYAQSQDLTSAAGFGAGAATGFGLYQYWNLRQDPFYDEDYSSPSPEDLEDARLLRMDIEGPDGPTQQGMN